MLRQQLPDVRNADPSMTGNHITNDLRISVESAVPNNANHMPKDPSRGQGMNLPRRSVPDDFTNKIESTKSIWDSYPSANDSALSPPGIQNAQNEDRASTTSDHAVEADASRDIPQHRSLVTDSVILPPTAVSSSVGVSFGNFNPREIVVPASSGENNPAGAYDTREAIGDIEISDIPEIPQVVTNHNHNPNPIISQTYSSSSHAAHQEHREKPPMSSYSTKPMSLYALPNSIVTGSSAAGLQLYPSTMAAFGLDLKQQSNEPAKTLPFPSVMLAPSQTMPLSTSQLTPMTPSTSLFSQVPTTQYSPLPSGDRVLSSSGFTTQTAFAHGSVIQPPSGSYQYNINQGPTVAQSPPAAPPQPQFAPIGYLPAAQPQHQQHHQQPTAHHQQPTHPQSGLQTNISAIFSSSLTQPSVPNQPYLSTPFSRGHELSSNSVIVKPQNTYPGAIGVAKTAASMAAQYGSVSNVAVQPGSIYGQVSFRLNCQVNQWDVWIIVKLTVSYCFNKLQTLCPVLIHSG